MCHNEWCGLCKNNRNYVYGHNKCDISYETTTDDETESETETD